MEEGGEEEGTARHVREALLRKLGEKVAFSRKERENCMRGQGKASKRLRARQGEQAAEACCVWKGGGGRGTSNVRGKQNISLQGKHAMFRCVTGGRPLAGPW